MSRELAHARTPSWLREGSAPTERDRLHGSKWRSCCAALIVGIPIAVGALLDPPITVFLVTAAAVCAAGLLNRAAFLRTFLWGVAILLLGYALLGKGFAYLGVAPIYVGEVVLGIGLIVGLVGGVPGVVSRSSLCWLLIAYMGWGALRTIPYLDVHGFDALRDAAIWAYGIYAILIAGCLLRTGWWRHVPSLYGSCVPWLLLWLPVGLAASSMGALGLPSLPGARVPILFLKPGDAAVHLAGIASFLLLRPDLGAKSPSRVLEWVCWGLWSCSFLVVASQNRGGMLAILAALAVTFMLRRSRRWMTLAFVSALLAAILMAWDFQLALRDSRPISPRQIFENAASVLTADGSRHLSGSRSWRLQWWGDIIDYTVYGDYFWGGKGFGINLATADGYQVGDGTSLRSPHNGHLTILARSGVPGFCLWLTVQGLLGAALARAAIRARRRGDFRWSAFHAWVLAYWVAFVVNMGFDVYLEGPQGGIWFWCLVGLGIASTEVERCRHCMASSTRLRWRPCEAGAGRA